MQARLKEQSFPFCYQCYCQFNESEVDIFPFRKLLVRMVNMFIRKILNKEEDKEGEEAGQDPGKVLVSSLDEVNKKRWRMSYNATNCLSPSQMCLEHIIHLMSKCLKNPSLCEMRKWLPLLYLSESRLWWVGTRWGLWYIKHPGYPG